MGLLSGGASECTAELFANGASRSFCPSSSARPRDGQDVEGCPHCPAGRRMFPCPAAPARHASPVRDPASSASRRGAGCTADRPQVPSLLRAVPDGREVVRGWGCGDCTNAYNQFSVKATPPLHLHHLVRTLLSAIRRRLAHQLPPYS